MKSVFIPLLQFYIMYFLQNHSQSFLLLCPKWDESFATLCYSILYFTLWVKIIRYFHPILASIHGRFLNINGVPDASRCALDPIANIVHVRKRMQCAFFRTNKKSLDTVCVSTCLRVGRVRTHIVRDLMYGESLSPLTIQRHQDTHKYYALAYVTFRTLLVRCVLRD